MQFFKTIYQLNEKPNNDENNEKNDSTKYVSRGRIERRNRNDAKGYVSRISKFNKKYAGEIFSSIAEISDDFVVACTIINKNAEPEFVANTFAKNVELDVNTFETNEITFGDFEDILRDADRYGFIDDLRDIENSFGLIPISGFSSFRGNDLSYSENLIDCDSKEDLYHKANNIFASQTILEELDRIYNAESKAVYGHPVQYIIEADNRDIRRDFHKILINALYDVKRIKNKRYAYLDVSPTEDINKRAFDALYKSSLGGTIIIRFDGSHVSDTDDDCAAPERDLFETLCTFVNRYHNDVLTVLCIPRDCEKIKEYISESSDGIGFVEIVEQCAKGEVAVDFVKKLAKERKIKTGKTLFDKIDMETAYLPNELENILNEWYDKRLKVSYYPQYSSFAMSKKSAAKADEKSNAYDELSKMIGLSNAKNVLNKALDFYKVQKIYKDNGINNEKVSMHMVFTGNPGTAKTTVARLFAKTLREKKILSSGHMVEVGRGDLVGKYVGWTAPTIQRKFKEAKGGVLFIDEAYSLVDDRNGSFGDEAINTIVQEMENHRDEVVVIFAGYPDKMEKFLDKNPGLRSRISFHVNFDDYSVEELCDITELMASKKGYKLADGVMDKLCDVYKANIGKKDFGNGRFVRNILEQARMSQASRIATMDFDDVTPNVLSTLCASDFEMTSNSCNEKVKKAIGFIE